MENEDDADYISFLRCLRQCDNSFVVETQPHGASSPIRVKYEGFNPPCVMQPNRKRIKPDLSANEAVNGDSGGDRAQLETDSVRRRKEKKDEGLSGRKVVFRGSNGRVYDCEGFRERGAFRCSNGTTVESDYPKETSKKEISLEIGGEGVDSERESNTVEEERENPVEVESQKTSPLPETVNPHVKMDDDPDYISFLRCLRQCDDSFMVETQPHGASSPICIKYGGFKPPCVMQPNRKRIKPELSANEAVNKESGGKISQLETDSVRSKRQRKEKKDEVLNRRKIIFRGSNGRVHDCEGFKKESERNFVFRCSDGRPDDSDYSNEASKRGISVEIGAEGIASDKENNRFEEERENMVGNVVSVEETEEIESQQISLQLELVNPHSQGFILLMNKLCPIEMAIYPGYNVGDGVTKPMAESSKSKSIGFDWIEERREEVESSRKGNKWGCAQTKVTAAFPNLWDSDEELAMDDIPLDVLSRPPSNYKDRLIKELKRPFDKYEYRELRNNAAHRNKKFVKKELRPKENGLKAEATPRIRERVIETEENSKSFFDWYPEVENKVKRARPGRGLALLRGFFFWLQNGCWEGSFKPWLKYRKGSKVHHDKK